MFLKMELNEYLHRRKNQIVSTNNSLKTHQNFIDHDHLVMESIVSYEYCLKERIADAVECRLVLKINYD